MSDTAPPVYTAAEFQASLGNYARLALATMKMLERVFGRDAVNAALAGHRDYAGLVELIKRIGVDKGEP